MSEKTIDYGCNDIGNKDRFIRQWGSKVKYLAEDRAWVAWDGTRWSDNDVRIYQKAEETAKSIHDEAKLANSKELSMHAHRSRNRGPIEAMLKLASDAVSVSINEFDKDPEVINCKNGLLNLRTGALVAHSPAQMLMKCANAHYDAAARCPVWVGFINEIFEGDKELINYMQQAMGYTLTGLIDEHCFFLLYGGGRNGKGTLAELMLTVMGDYGLPVDFESFLATDKSNVRVKEEVGRLKGQRYGLASETGDNRRFSEALIKRLTGGDSLTGTKLRGHSYSFSPTHKLWFLTNHLPAIKDATLAMWERVRVIPFNKEYLGDEQDKQLKQKLLAERDGIFAWVAEGARAYLTAGKLPDLPKACETARQQYRDENDALSRFIADEMTKELGSKAGVAETYRVYEAWCDRNNEDTVALRYFSKNMRERGIRSKPTNTGNVFTNYRLKGSEPSANDNDLDLSVGADPWTEYGKAMVNTNGSIPSFEEWRETQPRTDWRDDYQKLKDQG